MRDICPQHGIPYGNLSRIAEIIPPGAVNCNAIVGVSHKKILQENLTAGHQIDAVRPATCAEGLEIDNFDLSGLTHEYTVVRRVNDHNAFYTDILREGDSNSTESGESMEHRQINHPPTANNNILYPIADK
ncbi:hypothetical protein D3C74_428600 [compost metagenome]